MNKHIALLLFFGLSFASGFADGFLAARHRAYPALDFAEMAAYAALLFLWVYYDSLERGYRRPRWLSVGVVALGLIFVPVYLLKSRPKGSRAAALGGFALAALIYALLIVAGLFGGAMLHR